MSPRKNFHQQRVDQGISVQDILAKFEQDLWDKLRQSMKHVLVALIQAHQQPQVLPQLDDVFSKEEVNGGVDLLKEIQGDHVFDVYDDSDQVFEGCVDVDPYSYVSFEKENINFTGVQEEEQVFIVGDNGKCDVIFHINETDFLTIQNLKKVQLGKTEYVQIRENPPDQSHITHLFPRRRLLFFCGDDDLFYKICHSIVFDGRGTLARAELRACDVIARCGNLISFIYNEDDEPPDRDKCGGYFLRSFQQRGITSADFQMSCMKTELVLDMHIVTSKRESMTWDFEKFPLAHQVVCLIQKFERSRHNILAIKCVERTARRVKVSFDTLGFHSLLTSHTREQIQWRYLDHFHIGRMQYSDFDRLKLINETLGASTLFNIPENSTTVSEIHDPTLLFTMAFDSDSIRLLGHMKLIENCAPESFSVPFSFDGTSAEQETSGLVRRAFDSVHTLTTYNEQLLSLGHIETTATSVFFSASICYPCLGNDERRCCR